ncbi:MULTISPECIES: DUF3592 domain-containing protein [Arenibacter]|uniref:DUF3592 domain-containing protein n=1 Tax=Arenibacter TaxID=178469 RepID=UPI000A3C7D6C|nr:MULTISPECIES: DUF3592 domain-containing protein [Arenibacter]
MIITILIGLAITIYGIVYKILDRSAKKWPYTVGTINSAQLAEKINTDVDGRRTARYKVALAYEYAVGGIGPMLEGKQLFPYLEVWGTNRKEKIKILEKLEKGTKVKVYYNPRKTSHSCLIVGCNYAINYFIAFGLAFLAFPLVFWIYGKSNDLLGVLDQIWVN